MRKADSSAARKPALVGKVLCGYQGWFRCPGDGVTPPGNWFHWMRREGDGSIHPTVEMWPDTSEYSPAERFVAPGFTLPDGSPATLFSSAQFKTVRRHFEWMRRYGIDGVFVQRFLGHTDPSSFTSYVHVLPHVQRAARETGRAWCIEYDMSGTRESDLLDRLARDWGDLTQQRITDEPGYLHEKDKPVLAIWGFFAERFAAQTAHRILDYFLPRAYVVGGVNWPWRREADAEWQRAFRRFDALSPWNVGNAAKDAGGTLRVNLSTWNDDRKAVEDAGKLFLPVLYPGFRWNNLQKLPPNTVGIPRRRGDFLREQFTFAADQGLTTLKVAMFDEVDEGTAIFKVTNAPPREVPFLTLDGLPSDAYLRLVGDETAKVHRRLSGRR